MEENNVKNKIIALFRRNGIFRKSNTLRINWK